jgi:hypothetical protein
MTYFRQIFKESPGGLCNFRGAGGSGRGRYIVDDVSVSVVEEEVE